MSVPTRRVRSCKWFVALSRTAYRMFSRVGGVMGRPERTPCHPSDERKTRLSGEHGEHCTYRWEEIDVAVTVGGEKRRTVASALDVRSAFASDIVWIESPKSEPEEPEAKPRETARAGY